MNQLTLKQFIDYGNPCVGCNNIFNLFIKITPSYSTEYEDDINRDIIPSTSKDFLEFKLCKDKQQLLLQFFYEDNKITTSNLNGLAFYLLDHKIRFEKRCHRCSSYIVSSDLQWNLSELIINPIDIVAETIILEDKHYLYHLYINHNKIIVVIDKLSKTDNISPCRLELSNLDINRFRNKDQLISKIKTYMIFS